MSFNITKADQSLIDRTSFVIQNVDDVGDHGNSIIRFQFPPVIDSDSKEGKWSEIVDAPGFEPEYMYKGAMPRKIKITATYIVGGPSNPSLSSGQGQQGKWGIDAVTNQIRTWKKYFYFANLSAGGGVAVSKNLPIYRIVWGDLIADRGQGSAWRAKDYNVKYSDVWILDNNKSHPLITTISISLELATQVKISKIDKAKMPFPNLDQFAFPEWY